MAEKQTKNNPEVSGQKQNKPIYKKMEIKVHFNLKKFLSWLLIGFLILSFLFSLRTPVPQGEKTLPEILTDIKTQNIEKIEIEGDSIYAQYKDKNLYVAKKETQTSFIEVLKNANIDPSTVNFKIKDQSTMKAWGNILELLLPVVLTGIIFLWIFRQARGTQDSIFAFGRSKAKLFAKGKQSTTFKDVGGVDEVKQELEEIVDFLKHPKKYEALGARTPKGVLLIGPSGTGKTLLARAVAGEAGVPYFSMAGSEFMEMLVGVGASRVRDLFSNAKKASPAIIFIDEIDAIGRIRGLGVAGGHDEREQTLNQILVEMDGFTPNIHVIVIAASVTGETQILIKENENVKLVAIGKFIDSFFENSDKDGEVKVDNIACLGFERKISKGNLTHKNLYFEKSAFKKVSSLFRHKVNEIYEIKYLGGEIKATGNHSVFVRDKFGIKTKAVSALKKGDILVDLPYKVNRTKRELMEIRRHQFNPSWSLTLPFFDQKIEQVWQNKYLFATLNEEKLPQSKIGQAIGVSQVTVSNWQNGIGSPRSISRNYFKHEFPEKIKITPDFCRLLGYYVAEGYARSEVDFCFSIKENDIIEDLINLIKESIGINPDQIRHQTPGAVNIVYAAAPLADFLICYCGKGAANKHIPSFLFEAPYEYFIEFLKGVWLGDGYEDKYGRGEITSVSKRLIVELNWLCRMHGIKTYMHSFVASEGRRINNGKPLKAVRAYRLGWGKANNPFNKYFLEKTYPVKRAIIQEVKKAPFKGFVYDLCGVENEAFFGGESPILLHNTNRGDLLDPALMRPGRFDRRVILDLPDIEGRKKIIAIHKRGKPFEKDINWDGVAKRTVGFSGADLENMLNEAAIQAAVKNRKAITWDDIEEAATKVKMGPEKKRLQTKLDKEMTAYHEAGHAVATYHLPHMDTVHRVSIVSRGMALGYTMIPPNRDRIHETQSHLQQMIVSLLGGRAAEEIQFKEFTTGASSDIQRATEIARKMVTEFGMSELGPINLGPQVDIAEWGRSYFEPTQVSPEMSAKIDREIKIIVDKAYKETVKILKAQKPKLNLIAKKLIEKETIEGDEFEVLMKDGNK